MLIFTVETFLRRICGIWPVKKAKSPFLKQSIQRICHVGHSLCIISCDTANISNAAIKIIR